MTPREPPTPDADDESARLARDRERDYARMLARVEADRAKRGTADAR